MKVKFLLDRYMIDNSYHERLDETLMSMGYDVIVDKYYPIEDFPKKRHFSDDDCVVLYGSISFVNQYQRARKFVPGAYFSKEGFLCSRYMHRLPTNVLANHDYLMLPYGEFLRQHKRIYALFNTNKIFLRPDSGSKTFTGLAIHEDDFAHEINTLNRLLNVDHNSMVLVASCKNIEVEFRFFIVEGKVITGSQYKIGDDLIISPVVSPRCLALAQEIAQGPFQIDLAYACDIGIVDGEPKVIELNSFSAAGLYAADVKNLFSAVAECAAAEHRERWSLD